jgi:mono/diheme cytochrome c family protein
MPTVQILLDRTPCDRFVTFIEPPQRKGFEMRTGSVVMIWAMTLGVFGDAASAQQAMHRGATAGHEFALYNCDGCHVVAANQDVPPMPNYGPSFFDIANKPTTTAESLRIFLSHPHAYANMPYPDLSGTDLNNVVDYILSLRGKR